MCRFHANSSSHSATPSSEYFLSYNETALPLRRSALPLSHAKRDRDNPTMPSLVTSPFAVSHALSTTISALSFISKISVGVSKPSLT
jgi:hypothetical protein